MSLSALNTRSSVERAFASYLSTVDFGGVSAATLGGSFLGEETGAAHPFAVHVMAGDIGEEGELPEEWEQLELPALVVQSPDSTRHEIGYDVCELTLNAMTTHSENQAPDRTTIRLAWLMSIFDDANLEALAGTIAALVDGLTIIGIEYVGDSHQDNGRQIMGIVRLRVHATVTG